QPIENTEGPLRWWTNNEGQYPNLQCMTLDNRSVPSELLYYGHSFCSQLKRAVT
ncbi:hypothetical protein BS17DRAFT_708798, partial [Gyrodon lividus]